MTKTAEGRKDLRVALVDDFQVLDGQTGQLLGHISNLSLVGMMVIGAATPKVERVYRLTVALPGPIAGVTSIQIEATCRWHTFDVKAEIHKSGFQFGELAQLEKHIVEQIQTEYEFSKSEREL